MKNFNELKTKELINSVKTAKDKGESLVKTFFEFSKKYGYSQGSVRNHYYKVVKTTPKSGDVYSKLGLSDSLKPAFIKEFTRAEEKDLLYQIAKGIVNGKSVRKTVYELSNQSDKLALRYQNKFRNLVKNNSPLLSEVSNIIELETGVKVSFKKSGKTEKYLKLESEINKMLERLIKDISDENRRLKRDATKLKNENDKLKRVVKLTMQEKQFDKFAK